jgi:predicted porin
MHLAGSYDFGVVKGFAGYRNFKKTLATGAAEQRSDTYWLGANYAVAPNWTLTGTYYAQNIKNMAAGKDADPSMLVARAKYALSKRTDLYVSAAYAKAKNGLATGVSRDDAGFTNFRPVQRLVCSIASDLSCLLKRERFPGHVPGFLCGIRYPAMVPP